MNHKAPISQVLEEEEQARSMALRAAAASRSGDFAALAAEVAAFRDFLGDELEIHLAREEDDIFPQLAARGLEVEVSEATRQHGEIRRLRDALKALGAGDHEGMRALLGAAATTLARHVRYEADFLYVDLTQSEVTAFRARVDATIERWHAVATPPTLRTGGEPSEVF